MSKTRNGRLLSANTTAQAIDGFDGAAELGSIGASPVDSGLAVDLEAGYGMHAIPLARRAFSVLTTVIRALYFSAELRVRICS